MSLDLVSGDELERRLFRLLCLECLSEEREDDDESDRYLRLRLLDFLFLDRFDLLSEEELEEDLCRLCCLYFDDLSSDDIESDEEDRLFRGII